MLFKFFNERKKRDLFPDKMTHEKFMEICRTNFPLALHYNKLWRGDIVPLSPIYRNLFCLTDTKYDVQKLQLDLNNVRENTVTGWEDKGRGDKKNIWTSLTLKGYEGKIQPFLQKHSFIDPYGNNTFSYTENMEHCEYIREIFSELESMGCQIYLARILNLAPGEEIGFHTDDRIFTDKYNIIRCHIPIVTHAKCKMFLGYPTDIRVPANQMNKYKANVLWSKHLDVGRLWYTNVNCLHAVENKSDINRVHLVFDIKPTHEMLKKIYG